MILFQYTQLCKARLMAMVLVSTAVGYVLASQGTIHWTGLWLTVLGTGLAAGGAATLNQLLEADRDARMERTRNRPLPSGRISRPHALVFGVTLALAGLGILNEFVNPHTALLGLANLVIYLAVYTPLKPRTSLNTLVGAICGALPPLMGWSAVGEVSNLPSGGLASNWPGALILALVLFFWQIPHFLSLAWLYRDDFARGGFCMLPVIDRTGRLTCLAIVVYSLALMPLALLLTLCKVTGYLFGAASLVLGLGLFLLAVQLRATRTRLAARRVFLASIAYLPLLLALMVADMRTVGQVSNLPNVPFGDLSLARQVENLPHGATVQTADARPSSAAPGRE
jgi:protoheme IX farnesyltransferase